MTFDPANLRRHGRDYLTFYTGKFDAWREKNVGAEACHAPSAGAGSEHFKDILSDEEMEKLNSYLREDRPEGRESPAEPDTVDGGDVGVREVE